MTFCHYVCAVVLGCFCYCICQSLPSIWNFVKTPFVVKNINHLSTVSFHSIKTMLNDFLDEDFRITYADESNITFILKTFDTSIKQKFFNKTGHDLRQALVSKENFFYLALYNFLLCYDEAQDMNGKSLCIRTSPKEYSITPLGITFYKMLAANSKKCEGKTSVYRVCDRNEYGNFIGKPHYNRCYTNHAAFDKLKTKTFYL